MPIMTAPLIKGEPSAAMSETFRRLRSVRDARGRPEREGDAP